MIAHLHPRHQTSFVTGSAAPCTSIFKPVWVDFDLPDTGPKPAGKSDAHSLFWQHERLHRETMRDHHTRLNLYRSERDALEGEFAAQALALADNPVAERQKFSARCFQQAALAEADWLERINTAPIERNPSWYYRRAWNGLNKKAGLL
jgi:hypothetical protein